MKSPFLFLLFAPFILWAQNTQLQDFSISKDSIVKILDESYKKTYTGEYEKALELQNFALKWGELKKNDSIIGEAYDCLGGTFCQLKNYEKAEFNYKQSFLFLKKANYKSYMVYHHNNMATLYYLQEKIEACKQQYQKSIAIAAEINSTYHAFWPSYNIGALNFKDGEYDLALKQLKDALKYFQPNTDHNIEILIQCYKIINSIYIKKEQYDDALKNIKPVDSLANISGKYSQLIIAEDLKYQIYEAKKEYVLANKSLLKKVEYLEDSSEENARSIERKTKLQQQIIEQEKTIVQTRWFSIIIFVLFIITAVLLYLHYRNNLKRKKLYQKIVVKNKELKYASDLKTNFFSTISHELRTPLYAVAGITDILIEDSPKAEQKKYLQNLKSSGEYLLSLINNVLQINKFDADKVKIHKVDFDLKTLVTGITNSLSYLTEQNNNTIHIDISNNVPTHLKGDSLKLSQIIINLLSNALKFTQNGNIWLDVNLVEKEDSKVKLHFSIADDGIGISKEIQSKIFEDFYQESMQLERNYEGTGLGLAIVQRLIKALGSTIHVESDKNKGSKFFFDIVLEETHNLSVTTTSNDTDISDLASKHILVVDDNPINQMITQRILKKKNTKVTVVSSGVDAIKAAQEYNFDVILMDIHMPNMNGYTATEHIRKFNPTVPIIALTAVKLDENKEKIFNSGMNDVIVKPFKKEVFFKKLNSFLSFDSQDNI
ncbi:response regulator [uncultured Kordia sp.]|uniref:tetratricopeptide repeat-containing hybrid sensor histidine kinase/response regulator n=1 Tax=uncultured Kordia sp. TaxID=507699 RepID=UPI002625176F|nr:response regulator [uncultured Kordia sp.]